ncbi:unnamed protein product [Rotaria sp. Silwood1]|nr:unnamed protein product [Rotaria sp. Silwood1]
MQYSGYVLDLIKLLQSKTGFIPTFKRKCCSVNLRIGVIESVPFTIAQNVTDASGQSTMQYSGYVLDLIKLLQSKTGFIPTIKLAPKNQTYDGLIQAVVTVFTI